MINKREDSEWKTVEPKKKIIKIPVKYGIKEKKGQILSATKTKCSWHF